MTMTDWAIIIGPSVGALIGVGVSYGLTFYYDRKRESSAREREEREKKIEVFKALMKTREYRLSWDHAIALNSIPVEFNNEEKIINAWHAYLGHLRTNLPNGASDQEERVFYDKRAELFYEMLYKMARALDYDLDFIQIKNSGYSAVDHGNTEDQLRMIRHGLLGILYNRDGSHKLSIPMHITSVSPQEPPQEDGQAQENE